MQYRQLGNSNIEASVIGFGAWAIGGWMWGGADENEARDAVAAALDAGITLLDTAPMYGYGRSEEIIGRAIQGRRDKVILATKCGLTWTETELPPGHGELFLYGDEQGITKDPKKYYVYKYLRADAIRREVEDSLRRLQTDYIDLYQTHWQDATTPIEETMTTLLKLKEEGKIRAIGVSNATLDHIREYEKFGPVDTAQEKLSMLDRKLEQEGYIDYYRSHGISLLAYSPMANGLLTGRMDPNRQFPDGDLRKNNPRFQPDNIRKVNDLLARLKPMADAHGLSIVQLVIAWTAARYEKTHVLCGARRPEQVAENAGAGDASLSADTVQTIDDLLAESGIA